MLSSSIFLEINKFRSTKNIITIIYAVYHIAFLRLRERKKKIPFSGLLLRLLLLDLWYSLFVFVVIFLCCRLKRQKQYNRVSKVHAVECTMQYYIMDFPFIYIYYWFDAKKREKEIWKDKRSFSSLLLSVRMSMCVCVCWCLGWNINVRQIKTETNMWTLREALI